MEIAPNNGASNGKENAKMKWNLGLYRFRELGILDSAFGLRV